MSGTSSSLAARAVVAAVLLAGFYVLAVSIAAGLLYIPYAEWHYGHRVHIKVAVGCIGGALAILWSLLPRIDRFVAPGPELTPSSQPEMFKAIREVGERTKQELPASVYVLPEMNAWVAQRGGFLGIGSKRVMGIGLPLLQVTTTAQFKSVLAHEFGHYHGGDTSLGPWIYKTRQAISRTLYNLGDGSLLQKPFIWYGNLFLRITHAISRQQEYAADRLAAKIYGPDAAIAGLKAIYGHSSLYNSFWYNEVAPVLDAGRKPPLTEGFQHFVSAPLSSAAVASALEEEMKGREEDPYETHPSFRKRVEALTALPKRALPKDDPPAISLLRDVPALETGILSHLAAENGLPKLTPIAWGAVGSDIYLPHWEQGVEKHAGVFASLTTDDVAAAAADLPALGGRLAATGDPVTTEEQRKNRAAGLLGAALCLALQRRGWSMRVMPGEEVTFTMGGRTLQPFAAVRQLSEGTMKADDWRQQCADADIAALPLFEKKG